MRLIKSRSIGWSMLLAALLACPAIAKIETVHNVTVNGTTYQIVELLHVKRDRLPKWNVLKAKRGRHYHEYRLHNSDYTLKIYDEDFDAVKPALKGVPDNRSWDEKHPYYQPTVSTANALITIISLFK